MKTVHAMGFQGLPAAEHACNRLVTRGARIINVNRNMVSCQGSISEEYEVWFEHEGAADEEWCAEILKEVTAFLERSKT